MLLRRIRSCAAAPSAPDRDERNVAKADASTELSGRVGPSISERRRSGAAAARPRCKRAFCDVGSAGGHQASRLRPAAQRASRGPTTGPAQELVSGSQSSSGAAWAAYDHTLGFELDLHCFHGCSIIRYTTPGRRCVARPKGLRSGGASGLQRVCALTTTNGEPHARKRQQLRRYHQEFSHCTRRRGYRSPRVRWRSGSAEGLHEFETNTCMRESAGWHSARSARRHRDQRLWERRQRPDNRTEGSENCPVDWVCSCPSSA